MLIMAFVKTGRAIRFVACALFALVLWGWGGVKKAAAVTVNYNSTTKLLTITGDSSAENLQVAKHSTTEISVGGSVYDLKDNVANVEDIVIYGGAGNDTIGLDETGFTNLGDVNGDILMYGEGNDDCILGSALNDCVYAGDGLDSVYGNGGADTIFGEGDADTVLGGAGDDSIMGELGNDSLMGEAGHDKICGQEGNDSISGGNDVDWIWGGSGADSLLGDAGDDLIYGGEAIGEGALEHLDSGTDGADTIRGGSGKDDIFGELGADYLYGGTDDDTITGFGPNNDETSNDFIMGEDGADSLLGGSGADTVVGDAGSDTILGHAGDDCLVGGSGSDSILGGTGSDSLYYNNTAGQNDSANDTVWGNVPPNGSDGGDTHVGVYSGDVKDGVTQ